MPKNKPTNKTSFKEPSKTKKQNQRLDAPSETGPHFEKLNPEINAKLQSAVHEVIEKTLPKYKEWLNSALGEKIIDNDGSNESLHNIDKIIASAIDKAMKTAIQALKEFDHSRELWKNGLK